ncbi:MAG: ferric reductase-like transmembrane domain-containing protein [Actinomycetes bacterium]
MTASAVRPPATWLNGAPERSPSRRAGDTAAVLAGLGGGITIALTIPAVLGAHALTAPGGVATAGGALTAMVGTYLALLCIVLMARLPWLEREVGQDRLLLWHRRLAPWTLILIMAHVIFTPLGYAQANDDGWWSQLITMTFGYSWMLPAAAATLLLIALGLLSWRPIRRRMEYDSWHVAHLYFYLAIALAFGHQIDSGSILGNSRLATVWWVGLYVAVAASIVVFRIAGPLYRSLRHDIRVARAVPVDADTTHVYLYGKNMAALHAQGGQWFTWRFLTRNWWWQGHPYSLSAAPYGQFLRITIKNLGDQSAAIASLKPGTRVLIEGPYGAFRSDRRRADRLLLIGAGIGIAPIRALLDELPTHTDIDVIYRASNPPAPMTEELTRIAQWRAGRARMHLMFGSRQRFPMDARTLAVVVPDVSTRDVYACGPPEFVKSVRQACRQLGVPKHHIHDEPFEF